MTVVARPNPVGPLALLTCSVVVTGVSYGVLREEVIGIPRFMVLRPAGARLALVLSLGVLVQPLLASQAFAQSSVTGVARCARGPECNPGPVHASYPNYSSVCVSQDCNFVSAANLIEVTRHRRVPVSMLRSDYAQARQTYQGGLQMGPLWGYWKRSGIDGVYLSTVQPVSHVEANVDLAILAYGALLVEAHLANGAFLGATQYKPGGWTIMTVDGFTPVGPVVVLSGRTIQMTWAQWRSEARGVWGVTTSLTTPVPTPTATLSLSQMTITSSGGMVTLTFASTDSTNCSLSSSPSFWAGGPPSVSCSGSLQLDVLPSTTQGSWTFTFSATSAQNQVVSASQTLSESAPTPAASQSPNWSGYVVPSSKSLITDAQGSFVVPTLNCSDTPNGYSSIWAGIGGEQWSTGGSSGVLLQTGVDANCVGGVQQDDGWFEQWPSQPNHSVVFTGFPVAAGDQIDASVYETTAGQWVTLVSDVNTGLSGIMLTGASWGVGETSTIHTTGWTIQGTTAGLVYSGGYTAEWIVEDPTNTITQTGFPFANFGSVTWTNLQSSFTTWYLTQGETWAIVQGGVTLATPIATTADGFTVDYTGP